MSETEKKESSPFRRMQARGCGFVFFLAMMVAAAAWGAALGLFVWYLEDAKTQVVELDTYRPKVGSKIYSSEDGYRGELLGEYNIEYRQLVNLSEIPLHLQKAFIATEDDKFYQHKGVRPDAILNAALFILRTGRIRGGSTITQQLVRDVETVTGVSREQTLARKLQEAIVALQVEREFTKDEILELFLNKSFLGGSAYGVEAASQQYFGVSCRDLTLGQSAVLAGILRSPNNRRPDRYPDRATAVRNVVLGQMLENGFISQEEYDAAIAEDVAEQILTKEEREARLARGEGVLGPNRFLAPYFVEEMRQRAVQANLFTKEMLLEQGLEITTTLDMRLQRAAEEALFKELESFDEKKRKSLESQGRLDEFEPVSGALVCIDNRPGREGFVRALVGGRDWTQEKYNTVTQARRQPGSSVKPFVWAAALDEGRKTNLTAASIIMDEPFVRYDALGRTWNPKNFDGKYKGPVTLRYALQQSINTVSVRLVERIKMPMVRATIEKAGFEIPIDDTVGLTLGLGTHQVTVLEQCLAYATFANGGVYHPAVFVEEIKDRDGIPVYACTPQDLREMERRAFDPDLAYLMTYLLEGVTTWGTGARSADLNRPRAGKTGTTNDARDVWFCGYTPYYTCVVWIGYRDNRSLGRGNEYTGGRRACPVWTEFMIKAHEGLPVKEFEVPKSADGSPAVEFHSVDRQTSSGWAGGFREAFLKGTRPPASRAEEEEARRLEEQMEQQLLEGTEPPSAPTVPLQPSVPPGEAPPPLVPQI
ncbi:MAG: PBP1A family penicillin-binding protein [Candidatus Hydrogenedentes bacterium]|nr:PBP1A family penicillin-binding protein [Candidatus Hydrogenedentota bacterium]